MFNRFQNGKETHLRNEGALIQPIQAREEGLLPPPVFRRVVVSLELVAVKVHLVGRGPDVQGRDRRRLALIPCPIVSRSLTLHRLPVAGTVLRVQKGNPVVHPHLPRILSIQQGPVDRGLPHILESQRPSSVFTISRDYREDF